MRALFLHQNFPGQFRHVAAALAREPGAEIIAITDAGNKQAVDGVRTLRYRLEPPRRNGLTAAGAHLIHRFRRAEAAAAVMLELRRGGFVPDVVIGHPGWGELMLAKEVLPRSPLIAHAEFYYAAEGADVGFDPEFPGADDEIRMRLKAKNVPLLAALADCAAAIAPTAWQASCFPPEVAGKIRVIHEGIRTDAIRPDAGAEFAHGGLRLGAGHEVITFVNRNLEPLRGYHILMRALPAILAARPEAQAVIVGGDGVSYGAPPPKGQSWKQMFLGEVVERLPMERVHFVGQLPYRSFVALMQVSRLHIYGTYPFVLSWSMLEAMSAGALVLGSATGPVTEVIEHGWNGLLYDFLDVDGLAKAAIEALAEPGRHQELREAARRTIVERFDLATVCLPAWLKSVREIAGRG
jgi:glycosyltransferase involved in cell wall biosynthesis